MATMVWTPDSFESRFTSKTFSSAEEMDQWSSRAPGTDPNDVNIGGFRIISEDDLEDYHFVYAKWQSQCYGWVGMFKFATAFLVQKVSEQSFTESNFQDWLIWANKHVTPSESKPDIGAATVMQVYTGGQIQTWNIKNLKDTDIVIYAGNKAPSKQIPIIL